MNNPLIKHLPSCVMMLLALSTPAAVAAENEGSTDSALLQQPRSDWSVRLLPYLWLANYDGTFGLPSVPSGIPPIHSDAASPFSTSLAAAAMFTAELNYRDFGLMLDGAWAQLQTHGDAGSALYSGTEIKSDIAYGTGALTYRLSLIPNLHSEVIAGVRTWYISNEIEFHSGVAPGFNASNSRVWPDPILGASLRYDLTKHWFSTLLGDFGGFGVGSDITWQVYGGMGYQFTSWLSASLGYRYLHVDYDQDSFKMNANVQGFLLGVGFRF